VRAGLLVTVAAVAAIGGARFAREAAGERADVAAEPYAPSPTSAPLVTLGFREVAADLLWIRLTGYFGGPDSTSNGVASLVEAIVALDPTYHRPYEYGARAITIALSGVDQTSYLRALKVLERGIAEFPADWKLPYLAGQIYTQDLVTDDPKLRREWDERGTLLTESAIRKPGAPQQAATWVAFMRTKLGQRDRGEVGGGEAGIAGALAVTDEGRAHRLKGRSDRRGMPLPWRAVARPPLCSMPAPRCRRCEG